MFREQVPLKNLTSLKVGGPAEYYIAVKTESELKQAVEEAKQSGLDIHVLGGGTNVLIDEAGLPGLTIHNQLIGFGEQKLDEFTVEIKVGAGENFDNLINYTVTKGYWGLENLSHIPGSVGATPIQNVGAYGVEISELVTKVRVFNTDSLQVETLTPEACQFGYRDSVFKHEAGQHLIVLEVTFQLSVVVKPKLTYRDLAEYFAGSDKPTLLQIREAVIAIRSKKFPDWTKVGTAGSFFKNPIVRRVVYEKLRSDYPGLPGFDVSDIDVKIPLGWILDNVCGLRGTTRGKVGTYEGQALVLVHDGTATATEVIEFANYIADSVLQKTGITIEWEVTRLK